MQSAPKIYKLDFCRRSIYPEDLESCLYADSELAAITQSFCQSVSEESDGGVRPAFYFEIGTEPTKSLKNKFSSSILKHLIEINNDFREAYKEYPDTLIPEIHLFKIGEGPFEPKPGQIKQIRLL